MFKRIWKGWLDGWNKAWHASNSRFSIWAIVILPIGLAVAMLIVSMTAGVVLSRIKSLYLAGFVAAGAFVHIGILVPSIAKFGSWWSRSGPGGRRPIHTLWEWFKRSRIATWWLEGMVRSMVWATRHGFLAMTVLGVILIASIVAMDRLSEETLAILMYSTLSFLVVFPYLSKALSELWQKIPKTPHLLC